MKRLAFILALLLLVGRPALAQTVLTGTTCPGAGCEFIDTAQMGSVGIQIAGTWNATISFFVDAGAGSYSPLTVYPVGSSVGITSTTANGHWFGAVNGAKYVKIVVSPYVSGSATIYHTVSSATFTPPVVAVLSASSQATLTASVNVKASAGNVYGVFALNGAASTCWVQFINSASAGTLGTGVIFAVPLPASTTQPVWIQLDTALSNFAAGIAVGVATTPTGAVACGTGGNVIVFYK